MELQRRGGKPEETTADSVAPYAGMVGTAAGMYAANNAGNIYNWATGATNAAQQAGTQAVAQGAQQAAMQGAQQAGTQAVAQQAVAQGAQQAGTQAVAQGAQQAGTQAAASGWGGYASQALPYLGAAAGAYGLYQVAEQGFDQRQTGSDLAMTAGTGAVSGAALGSYFGPWGTGIGAVLGGLYGLAAGYTGGAKGEHQLARDRGIDVMERTGFIQDDQDGIFRSPFEASREYNNVGHKGERIGNNFFIGGDGGFRLDDGRQNFEIIKGQADGNAERDYTEQESYNLRSLIPASMLISGHGQDKQEIMGNTAMRLYNALDNTGEDGISDNELRATYRQLTGAEDDDSAQMKAFETLNYMAQTGRISKEDQIAGQIGLNQAFGKNYFSPNDPEAIADAVNKTVARLYGSK
jgi:hypothetical protein